MIAMRRMLSTHRLMRSRLLTVLLAVVLAVGGCAAQLAPPGAAIVPPTETAGAFVMPDGMRLPYRTWLPDDARDQPVPRAVMLALHGMNDSRDAWEYPGPAFAEHGIAVFSPDQRGFGATVSARLLAGHAGAGRRCA